MIRKILTFCDPNAEEEVARRAGSANACPAAAQSEPCMICRPAPMAWCILSSADACRVSYPCHASAVNRRGRTQETRQEGRRKEGAPKLPSLPMHAHSNTCVLCLLCYPPTVVKQIHRCYDGSHIRCACAVAIATPPPIMHALQHSHHSAAAIWTTRPCIVICIPPGPCVRVQPTRPFDAFWIPPHQLIDAPTSPSPSAHSPNP
jgi:hypothetical protein